MMWIYICMYGVQKFGIFSVFCYIANISSKFQNSPHSKGVVVINMCKFADFFFGLFLISYFWLFLATELFSVPEYATSIFLGIPLTQWFID